MAKPKLEDELNLPELPDGFMHMVADHAFRLDGHGHNIRFEPGTPVPVYYMLQPEALAHGAKPLGGNAAVATAPKVDPQKDPSSPEYRAAVRTAAETILSTNDPADFGANGKPYKSAWERELGWAPIMSIRDEIWSSVKWG